MHDSQYWIEQVPFFCTMLSATSLLQIPHPNEYFRKQGQFKWPSLDELHNFLFGCEIEGRESFHDALVDVKGTARCYFELIRRRNTTKSRVTPDMIERLDANQIFVFGSNTDGRHGGGAAHYAHKCFGAEWGVAEGMTGKTYAIPTCTAFIEKIGLDAIAESVKRFAEQARRTPEAEYLVTPIGCGIAGFTVEEIAPLFSDCVNIENVCLPQSFWTILK